MFEPPRFGLSSNEPVPGRVFWTLGDGPTQEDLRVSRRWLEAELKAQVLLSDEILASASYFYESRLTQDLVMGPARGLVRDGELRLFVGSDLQNFEHHASEKAKKSPLEMLEYGQPAMLARLSRQLDRLTEPMFRRPVDISGAIIELWLADLVDNRPGTLGGLACEIDGVAEGTTATLLAQIAAERKGDFVWPFVLPRLQGNGFPKHRLGEVKHRLNQLYARASAEAVDAFIDLADPVSSDSKVTHASAQDPFLLLKTLRALGLLTDFLNLSVDQVRDLKRTQGWTAFRPLYVALVEAAVSLSGDVTIALPLLQHAHNSGLTRDEFTTALARVLHDELDGWTLERCATMSEKFLTLTDVFGDNPIALLEHSLREDLPRMTGRRVASTPLAFIVHGHDAALRLDLKNYIQNTLGWQEPVVLAEKRSGGRTIIEKFEENAEKADYAFILLSPDDLTKDSEARARQNVIFELGFFVGYFGRKSGQVLVLRKGDVRLPGDLDGVIYIDVSAGIAAAGEEIRRELNVS